MQQEKPCSHFKPLSHFWHARDSAHFPTRGREEEKKPDLKQKLCLTSLKVTWGLVQDNSISVLFLFFYKKKKKENEIDMILKEAYSRGYPESATCVQRFDDSLNSAIRITYRISLRSSSSREPRYPLLRVVFYFVFFIFKFFVFVFDLLKGVYKFFCLQKKKNKGDREREKNSQPLSTFFSFFSTKK